MSLDKMRQFLIARMKVSGQDRISKCQELTLRMWVVAYELPGRGEIELGPRVLQP